MVETVTVMRRPYGDTSADASPILLGLDQVSVDVSRSGAHRDALWPGDDFAHARRDDLEVSVIACAVLRRRLPDDFGEARAERAERCTTDSDARVGDGRSLPQE